ncbi:angiopoietin-related protein 7-like [Drosophila montana]|uniref:angiopoietin-related protein 7-like n=1 Tax=Drosophila montana TaxID=40370 RepID=UPI00313E2D6F
MQSKIFVHIILVLLTLENSLASYEQAETMLSKCENLYSKFSELQKSYNAIKEKRKQQTNIYKKLVKSLTINNEKLKDKINLQGTLRVKPNELQNITRELHGLKQTIDETFTKLNSSELTMQEQREQLLQKTNELSKANRKINAQASTIDVMNVTLMQQDDRIAEFEGQAEATKQHLRENQELKAKLTISDKSIGTMSNKIIELQSQVNSDAASIEQLNSVIAAYTNCCKASSCEQFGKSSNVHVIKVPGVGEPFRVLCNGQIAGPGWTVIQRRINGSVDFYRNWSDYKTGFGDLAGEFFIGLEKLHHMTEAEPQELYIQLEDFDGQTRYATYDDFKVGSELESYALQSLGNFGGDMDDALSLNVGQKFSTYDRDNDNDESLSCAERFHGAWWYYACGLSNLNGPYQTPDDYTSNQGILWVGTDWHDNYYSFKSVQIMIKARNYKLNQK